MKHWQPTGLLQVTDNSLTTDSSGLTSSQGSLSGGYEMVYTSITYGGMSGGPVLDSQGQVIGIHGRAEGEEAYDSKTGECGGSGSTCQIQIGFSLGVPVSTFLGLVQRLGVKPQQLTNTRPPQINSQQVESIKKAALTADVSGENATADKWLERWNFDDYEFYKLFFSQTPTSIKHTAGGSDTSTFLKKKKKTGGIKITLVFSLYFNHEYHHFK